MQTIIQNKLSEMFDELLKKAFEEKPKKIEEGYRYESYSFKWDNCIILITPREEKQEVTILLPHFYSVGWGRFVLDDIPFYYTYALDYTDNQKEMIKKIFDKWSKEYDS